MDPTYTVNLLDYVVPLAYADVEPPRFESLELAKRYAEILRREHFPSRDRYYIQINMETINV